MSQAEKLAPLPQGTQSGRQMIVIRQGGKPAKASQSSLVNSLAKLNASSVTELMLEKRNSVQRDSRSVAIAVK